MLVERFNLPATLSATPSRRDAETVQFAQAALVSAKQEGLQLAVRARYVALAVIGCLLLVINPAWEQLYYVALLGLFALIGWAQVRVGRVGVSRPELALLFCDLALLTLIIVVPNPFGTAHWPVAMQYHFGNFIYFFVLLAGATLAYSWRTVIAMGTWTAALWMIGMAWVWWTPDRDPALTARIAAAVGSDHRLFAMISPNAIGFHVRIQEIVVFMIVAATLALAVRRSNELLVRHAAVERERGNLARYFSPNVVAELSKQDEPLKQVRTQHAAVLFVDIVGFTAFADARSPQEVVRTLREFHGLMEQEVFRHGGTLDKYLGDGLMATFGTPFAGANDASNALRCAQAMITAADGWNEQRRASGEPPLRVSFGLHYGPVVLGDIGQTCLEFAVIGATVNTASRLEALTRTFDCALVASEDLVSRAKAELGNAAETFQPLMAREPQTIRGIQRPIGIWTQARGSQLADRT
ncbi:adenylate/guanylate cyclase domain-containing protein [Bradyrhizobium cajani]|uniref:Adenylate/guanylate cyclase domain-containing protein n=1 Tax=Bradyrhizobium cajani TaxID=1928661 RepID=A0A844TGU7_9BRAD|nr:adenylate/guanylate cyclase domain-containing protein [Bradyrhizobium cajani]MCP3370171.1 adenylate/guanylate cyclase domain-containing protein [Bradyrhizobium cajani]MVT77616.1 adenylate/guanylate cyclase domain-containing protein [Bradyrhizobium cajani]